MLCHCSTSVNVDHRPRKRGASLLRGFFLFPVVVCLCFYCSCELWLHSVILISCWFRWCASCMQLLLYCVKWFSNFLWKALMKSAISLLYCWVFCKVAQMLSGMAALNGGLGATGLTNGTAGTMDALTQAYSGIQQYAAAALPTLYSQSLLQQQSAAGSQKEGTCHPRPRAWPGVASPVGSLHLHSMFSKTLDWASVIEKAIVLFLVFVSFFFFWETWYA